MRRLVRTPCPNSVLRVLSGRQARVNSGNPVKDEWKSFSALKAYRDLKHELERSLGRRSRCSYCSDSLGVEVEHFWPKEQYVARAFVYENLFLVCGACNRRKSSRFPLDNTGSPLIIDPFYDDPWDSLYFDSTTGIIIPRFLGVDSTGTASKSAKGELTLDVLGDIINCEPVRAGRRQNWLSIVQRFGEIMDSHVVLNGSVDHFDDIDEFGLSEWLLRREGKEASEVATLRATFSERWLEIRDLPRC